MALGIGKGDAMNGTWTSENSYGIKIIRMTLVAAAIIIVLLAIYIYRPQRILADGSPVSYLLPFGVQCLGALAALLFAWQINRVIKPFVVTIDNQGVYQTHGPYTLHTYFSDVSSALNQGDMKVTFTFKTETDDPEALESIGLGPFGNDSRAIVESLRSHIQVDDVKLTPRYR